MYKYIFDICSWNMCARELICKLVLNLNYQTFPRHIGSYVFILSSQEILKSFQKYKCLYMAINFRFILHKLIKERYVYFKIFNFLLSNFPVFVMHV